MTIVADVRPDLMPYYKDDCDPKNLAPLWEVLHTFARKTPKSDCQPYIWHYNDIRDTLMKSADLITAEQAERRVPRQSVLVLVRELIREGVASNGGASAQVSLMPRSPAHRV